MGENWKVMDSQRKLPGLVSLRWLQIAALLEQHCAEEKSNSESERSTQMKGVREFRVKVTIFYGRNKFQAMRRDKEINV